ncbi:MAG TPA: toll/interleukin-1 receptor domain-containing protein [Polyangiaceae bacterium]|nr:toll/interleukin-1 receptor domain-containing protein [Polyangiaceae bacterium]
MPSVFFVSYARKNKDKKLERFLERLIEEVVQRVQGATRANVAFFDRDDIKSGDEWLKRLADGARTSKAYLAVCSPDFVCSEYCGREFAVFLKRGEQRSVPAGSTPPQLPIFPVRWVARDESSQQGMGDVPEPLRRYQVTPPPPGALAKTPLDLRTIYNLDKYRARRAEIVDELAKRIAAVAIGDSTLPEGEPITDFASLPSAFVEPASVRLGIAILSLVEEPLPWAGQRSLTELVRVAIGATTPTRILRSGAALRDALSEAAQNQEAILVLGTPNALGAPEAAAALALLDQLAPGFVTVLLLRPPIDAAVDSQLELAIKTVLPAATYAGLRVDVTRSRSEQSFVELLTAEVAALRQAVRSTAPARKAEDATLERVALAQQGIRVAVSPQITGPGRAS